MHILNIMALAARHSPAPFPMYTAWQEISGWTEFTWHSCTSLWSFFGAKIWHQKQIETRPRQGHSCSEKKTQAGRPKQSNEEPYVLSEGHRCKFFYITMMMMIKKNGFYSLPLGQETNTSSQSLRSKQQCDGPALNGPSLLRYQKMHKYLGRQKRGKLLINGHGGSDLGRL